MRFLLFLGFLAAATLAAQPKISVSRTSIDLISGQTVSVQYALDAPIVCPSTAVHCDVVLKLSNSRPDIIAMDNCVLRWNYNEFSAIRTVKIQVKSAFVAGVQINAKITAEAVDSSSIYYSGLYL